MASPTVILNGQAAPRPSKVTMILSILESVVLNIVTSVKAWSVSFRYVAVGYRVPLGDEQEIHEWFGSPGSPSRKRAPDVGTYIKPGTSDTRSPCPAVNTMANHGFLPRNGRNVSGGDFVRAMQAAYNVSTPLAYLIAYGTLFLIGKLFRKVTLADLALHDGVEHDASLIRQNALPRARYAPTQACPVLSQQLVGDARDGCYTVEEFSKARIRREKEPGTYLDELHKEIARGEAALALNLFGGGEGKMPLEVLETWWIGERLPENWDPSREVTLLGTAKISRQIRHAMKRLRKEEGDC